jgi:hypothetical protein
MKVRGVLCIGLGIGLGIGWFNSSLSMVPTALSNYRALAKADTGVYKVQLQLYS